MENILPSIIFLRTKYISQTEGQTFCCGIDTWKVLAKIQHILLWMFTEKQMNVFQYQRLFRAMSSHGCSLNDNRFMLAYYCCGTGDWH